MTKRYGTGPQAAAHTDRAVFLPMGRVTDDIVPVAGEEFEPAVSIGRRPGGHGPHRETSDCRPTRSSSERTSAIQADGADFVDHYRAPDTGRREE